MLEESVIVQDWIQKGLQKGLEQGLEQGERQLLLRQLTKRFGRLSAKTRKRIESLSLKKIEKLGEDFLSFNEKNELEEWLNKFSR